MLNMKANSPEVYIANEPIASVGNQEIGFLKEKVRETERKRTRLNAHKNNEDRLHEMFIVFDGGTYLRPSKHLNKDESLHVLEGEGDYVFFDDAGNITDVIPLGTLNSGRQFYCRIPEFANHALFIRSEKMVIHETTEGPFNKSDTVFAPWSPDEANQTAIYSYKKNLAASMFKREREMIRMRADSKEVYVAEEPIVSVGRKEIAFLKARVNDSERKRVRLCAHKDVADALHEMFVVYTTQTYVRPNKHLGKDESLHILEGAADFIFFDETGNVTDVIPLGAYGSGRQFYCRVPESLYHTLIMRSDALVIHEATPGPFVRADTVWAPWAPPENDAGAVSSFLSKLEAKIQELTSLRPRQIDAHHP